MPICARIGCIRSSLGIQWIFLESRYELKLSLKTNYLSMMPCINERDAKSNKECQAENKETTDSTSLSTTILIPDKKNLDQDRPNKRQKLQVYKGYRVPQRTDYLVGCEYAFDREKRLCRVKPYYWDYITHAKQRWDNRTLYDIFSTEYRERSPEYTESIIKKGLIKVNGVAATCETIVHTSDVIEHSSHRHEPPVPDTPIDIVYRSNHLIVVNKPNGIPVHPTGRYRHNSVLNMLRKKLGIGNSDLAPCNRLDRLTSGICFFALNQKTSESFRSQLENVALFKLYVAKVWGEFPDGIIICDQPIEVANPKLGLNRVSQHGKSARSVFQKLCSNKKYSIVLCRPLTGRTHQLRVHLQWLGYPIANDPLYANKRIWGPTLGRKGEFIDWQRVEYLVDEIGKSETADFEWYTNESPEEAQKRREQRLGELMTGESCKECGAPLYTDPVQSELLIWLHSLKYWAKDSEAKGSNWSYETKMPSWAQEDLDNAQIVFSEHDLNEIIKIGYSKKSSK